MVLHIQIEYSEGATSNFLNQSKEDLLNIPALVGGILRPRKNDGMQEYENACNNSTQLNLCSQNIRQPVSIILSEECYRN